MLDAAYAAVPTAAADPVPTTAPAAITAAVELQEKYWDEYWASWISSAAGGWQNAMQPPSLPPSSSPSLAPLPNVAVHLAFDPVWQPPPTHLPPQPWDITRRTSMVVFLMALAMKHLP